MNGSVERSLSALHSWCEKEGFKGWDPFDGLNSKLFRNIPFLHDSSFARLAWIQLFKRSPFNFRPVAGVPKQYNPKGLGLFLAGYCNLWRMEERPEYLDTIRFLSKKILEMRSEGWSGSCWGYNFDWQARAFFQPAGTPTVVASSFIAHALLDAHEILKEKELLNAALSVGDFITKDLNKTWDDRGNFAFSYSPADKTTVYNASMLGSAILARIYAISGSQDVFGEAKRSMQYCVNCQNPDGSWYYSPLNHHHWIDNFHTGFNLESLSRYMNYTGDSSFRENLERGFRFYIENFFSPEGKPKYYISSLYPVDLHSAAQLVLTCSHTGKFKENRSQVERVLNWSITNMQSEKGFFYYQRNNYLTNKIPYMRWTQAWMFLAMAVYLLKTKLD